MKTQSNITYANFQQKKSEKNIYNTCYDKWLKIKRACDPSKTIAYEAIAITAAIEFLFTKNPDEVIFSSKLLKEKCNQGDDQRRRFLRQLDDIYDIKYHTAYNYKGKKYRCVYSAKRTENSLKILQNPALFYSNEPCKNSGVTLQKFGGNPAKIRATYIDIETLIEYPLDDLSDLSKTAEINNVEILEAKDQKYQSKNIEIDQEEDSENQYKNTLLKNFKPTNEILDKVRELSNKPHFTNDRIIALIRTIVSKRPDTKIFGKAQAFINYLVKAVNKEKEYTEAERLLSIEERNQQEAEFGIFLIQNGVKYF